MEFVNLTPHDIVVYDAEGKEVIATYPPSGIIARIREDPDRWGTCDGIPIVLVSLEGIEGLPEVKPDVTLIVSMPVVMTYNSMPRRGPRRPDLLYPYDLVRDDKGGIIGCRSLAKLC